VEAAWKYRFRLLPFLRSGAFSVLTTCVLLCCGYYMDLVSMESRILQVVIAYKTGDGSFERRNKYTEGIFSKTYIQAKDITNI